MHRRVVALCNIEFTLGNLLSLCTTCPRVRKVSADYDDDDNNVGDDDDDDDGDDNDDDDGDDDDGDGHDNEVGNDVIAEFIGFSFI